ncbi:MAG: hypothetical protein M1281_05955 [Chloroflexi bacterium]|nr:hypothetical protein [Chloroflexota bacterium]
MANKKLLPLLLAGALIVVAVVGVFVLGVITYRTVMAEAPSATPSPAPNKPAHPGLGKGLERGFTEQDLATALGIDVAKLQTAYQSAADQALQQAVSSGLLTQQQADKLKGRPFGWEMLGGEGWLGQSGIDFNALLAKALGVSVDQLQAAYQKAFSASLDRLVQNGTLTQQQADALLGRFALANSAKFQSAMQAAFEAAVKQAVTDGLITQSQADQILKDGSGLGLFKMAPGGMLKGFGGFQNFRGFGRRNWPGGKSPANPGRPTPTPAPSGGM